MQGEAPREVVLRSLLLTSLRVVGLLVFTLTSIAQAQAPAPTAPESVPPEPPPRASAPRSGGVPVDPALTPTEYRIGVDDVLAINVLQAPELNISVRVAEAGDISLPLIGVMRASLLTTRELEEAIKERLRAGFIRDPEVTVLVTEVRSRGVSVVGAVHRPGLIQVRGSTTLLEVLSLAGGLADNAGDSVMVVRPEGGGTKTIDIKLRALLAADPAGQHPAASPRCRQCAERGTRLRDGRREQAGRVRHAGQRPVDRASCIGLRRRHGGRRRQARGHRASSRRVRTAHRNSGGPRSHSQGSFAGRGDAGPGLALRSRQRREERFEGDA